MSTIDEAKSQINAAMEKLCIHDLRNDWPKYASVEVHSEDDYSGFDWQEVDERIHFTIYNSVTSDGVKEIISWLAQLKVQWTKGYFRKYSFIPNLLILLNIFGGYGFVLWSTVVFDPAIGVVLSMLGVLILLLIVFDYYSRLNRVNDEYKSNLLLTNAFSNETIDNLVRNSRWKRRTRTFLPLITLLGASLYSFLFIIILTA